MKDVAQRCRFLDEWTNTKSAEDALGGQTLFGDGCVSRDRLAIQTLQEVIRRQRDFEQVDEGFDALRRFEEQRPDRQRRLPLMMALFNVALLLELGEEGVGTARYGRRREQRGIAIVGGVGLGGGFVVVENEAVRRPTTTALRRRQDGALVSAEWHELPAEVAGGGALPEEFDDAAMDWHRVVPTEVAARD